MRLTHLLALAAPIALLLPLSAQAAWPNGQREAYMKDCTIAANRSVDLKTAQQHCACSADQLNDKFTSAELAELMHPKDPSKGPSKELQTKALQVVSACRVSK
ncbi:hypothetical protein SAMN05216598_5212 [Pseudomonas asplenii]|uniref:Uncharacterized protein n=1 Tax=Pseudomonas asplenii TaxID=53407 RepID=A0A1H1ZNN2_9PSED|nr:MULTISPECIES: hypothetical protein [Pseudomonas]UZE31130.1 hypothetical protein LOY63_10535 [Pseudomonas asplenii]SDT35415.1 hypothetical protein SAMN05216598_5212 [Pseudomonas asplenii]SEI16936.1 hypothetical protein SAMN05216581_3263 [Pseudomonas fuscovaginae]